MRIVPLNNQYQNTNLNKTKKHNTNISFKEYLGCNRKAVSKLSVEHLEWLTKAVDSLKDAVHCDFLIMQHPDTRDTTPVIALKIKNALEMYTVDGLGNRKQQVRETREMINAEYLAGEIRECHSGALPRGYSFCIPTDREFKQIYEQCKRQTESELSIRRYYDNKKIFDGITLVRAIEKFQKQLEENKAKAQSLISLL